MTNYFIKDSKYFLHQLSFSRKNWLILSYSCMRSLLFSFTLSQYTLYFRFTLSFSVTLSYTLMLSLYLLHNIGSIYLSASLILARSLLALFGTK